MRDITELLARFTNPEEVTLPSNRLWAWRVGPEWHGMRHLLVVPKPQQEGEQLHPRLLQIEIRPTATGANPVDPLVALTRAFHRSADEMYQLVWEAPAIDMYCPYQAYIMEREVRISSLFDREAGTGDMQPVRAGDGVDKQIAPTPTGSHAGTGRRSTIAGTRRYPTGQDLSGAAEPAEERTATGTAR